MTLLCTQIGEAFTELFKEGVVKREDLFVTSKLWWVGVAFP